MKPKPQDASGTSVFRRPTWESVKQVFTPPAVRAVQIARDELARRRRAAKQPQAQPGQK